MRRADHHPQKHSYLGLLYCGYLCNTVFRRIFGFTAFRDYFIAPCMIRDAFLAITIGDFAEYLLSLGNQYANHVEVGGSDGDWLRFAVGIAGECSNLVCKCGMCQQPPPWMFRKLPSLSGMEFSQWKESLARLHSDVPSIPRNFYLKLIKLRDAQIRFAEWDPKLLQRLDLGSNLFQRLLDPSNVIKSEISKNLVKKLRKLLNSRISVVVAPSELISGRLVKLNESNGEFTLVELDRNSSPDNKNKLFNFAAHRIKLDLKKHFKKAGALDDSEIGSWKKIRDEQVKKPSSMNLELPRSKKPATISVGKQAKKKPTVSTEEFVPHSFEHSTAPHSFWSGVAQVSSSVSEPLSQRLRSQFKEKDSELKNGD